MPNYERGAYEPSDEVRVFDGAEDEEDEEGSRLPLLIVMALLVLAAFGGVVWLAYERGVASGRTEPRILAAEEGPAKVAPSNPGGTESPYKGLKIYDQPAPNDEESDSEDTAVAKPPAPAPVKRAATKPTPRMTPATVAQAKTPHASEPAVKPVAKLAPTIATKPAAKPAATTVVAAPPSAAVPKLPVDAPLAAPVMPAAPAATGSYVLQIGAYKSQAEADNSWKAFQAKHSSLLSGFSSNVKQVDLGDKGVWYRLRVGAFADKDAASALCDKLKADGGNCFLAK